VNIPFALHLHIKTTLANAGLYWTRNPVLVSRLPYTPTLPRGMIIHHSCSPMLSFFVTYPWRR